VPIDGETIGDGTTSAEHESVNTDSATINSTYYYAGSDSELTEVLSNVTDGDVIHLGSSSYASDRTFNNELKIVGTGESFRNSTSIDGTWTFNGRVHLHDLILDSGSLTVPAFLMITGCLLGTADSVTITGDSVRYVNNTGGAVTFESGTSSGIVDACSRTNVTDNGTNTVGDIA
jgi:hypothetical protein